jgi:spermidine synthase
MSKSSKRIAVEKGGRAPVTREEVISRSFLNYLIFTAILCGALVMVVEVLGSRVLGPFFGVSLFVWTSLITVTLVALAAGYAVGGVLSDKKNTPDYLYGIIIAAGLFVLLIPWTKGIVLKTCLPLGLRLGALISSLFLFGPSLFLLGGVSPYLIKIAAKEMKYIGRTVGIFYALSTLGSFLGTILTGFVLIAYLGINRIFSVAGFLLICLSLGYFAYFRRKWLVLALLMVTPLMFTADSPVSKVMANGTRVTVEYNKDSFYGNVKVVDYINDTIHVRELMIDGLVQSGIDMSDGMSIFEYPYFMEFLPYNLNPDGRSCVVVGLGAGVIPVWYESRGIKTDVVDINPEVVTLARQYFGFHNSGDVIISDARHYFSRTNKKYDYVVLDVFTGETTPGHILSLEAMTLVKSHLTARGIVAINLAGSLKKETLMTASVIRTLEKVFTYVEVYPVFSPTEGEGCGNLEIVAYQQPTVPFRPQGVQQFPVHRLAKEGVNRFIGKSFHLPDTAEALVLSDNYNPLDFYDLWLKENLRKTILENTDWDILI